MAAVANNSNNKMDFLLDEARSDLKKLANFSGWPSQQHRDQTQTEAGGDENTNTANTDKQQDEDATREHFQVVPRPAATVAVDADRDAAPEGVVGVGAVEADKLAWLLEEARADFERTATTVTAEVVRTASSVSRKLSSTQAASLLARSALGGGASSPRSINGNGTMSSAAARAMAGDPYGPPPDLVEDLRNDANDENKLHWLVAEAKADVTRAATTLSRKLGTSRVSSTLSCASSSSSREVHVGDSSSMVSASGASTSKKRRNPTTLPNPAAVQKTQDTTNAKAQPQQQSFLMQEAQEDLKKLVNFLGLSEFRTSGQPAAAAATENAAVDDSGAPPPSSPSSSSVPRTIEITSQEDGDVNAAAAAAPQPEGTTLTYHPPASPARAAAAQEEEEEKKQPPPPRKKTAAEESEAAVMRAYIDDKWSGSDGGEGGDRYFSAAEAAMSDDVKAGGNNNTNEAAAAAGVPPALSDESAPTEVEDPQDLARDDDTDDFVPITERDTYSQSDGEGGNASDGWDMTDDFGAAGGAPPRPAKDGKVSSLDEWRRARGGYRAQSSKRDVDSKVQKLLNALGSDDTEKRKRSAEEVADDLIRDAAQQRSVKNNYTL